jgi:hypothetical protein
VRFFLAQQPLLLALAFAVSAVSTRPARSLTTVVSDALLRRTTL